MKSIQFANTTKTRDVIDRYILLPHTKKTEKLDDCYSRDDVRTGRGSPCAVLLPFSMAASLP